MLRVEEAVGEDAHAFGGTAGYHMHSGGNGGGMQVDVVDGHTGTHVVEQRGGGIYGQRCADDDEHVGAGRYLGGGLEVGHGFLEEHYVGTHAVAFDYGVGRGLAMGLVEGIDETFVVEGAHLVEFAVEVEPLKVQYPQGGEKQLIAAITGREVPPPPGLPIHVGAVVCNASTALAVYEAVQKNKPLIERVVTVTGKAVKEPRNLLTRMGTPISTLIELAGGLPEGDVKVVNGGPMMGRAMVNIDSPVTKGCSGITVFSGEDARRVPTSECIKCAKCVEACPMGLEPYLLQRLASKQMWEEMEQERIPDCIECGCCQYTCPAGIALLDYVRLGKQTVMGIIRARAAAAAAAKK